MRSLGGEADLPSCVGVGSIYQYADDTVKREIIDYYVKSMYLTFFKANISN